MGWAGSTGGPFDGYGNLTSGENKKGGGVVYPQSASIIFDANLGTSTTPIVGGSPTFARASTSTFWDSASTLGTASSGNPCLPAYPYGGTGAGMFKCNTFDNYLFYSEAPATSPWASVGTPTSINNSVGTWFVGGTSVTYGSIVAANAGDGITQKTGVDAASHTYLVSLWAKTSSGTLAFTVTVSGEAPTPESSTYNFTATTTIQEFNCFNTFTAGATGKICVSITCDAAGTLLLAGMSLSLSQYFDVRPTYIKTTSAAVTRAGDTLYYPSTSVDMEKGTYTCWLCCPYANTAINQNPSCYTISANNLKLAFFFYSSTTNGYIYYNDANPLVHAGISWSANTWFMMSMTWDNRSSPAPATFTIGKNDARLKTTTSALATPAAGNVAIGGYLAGTAPEWDWKGLVGKCKIWNVPLSETECAEVYNIEKGYYGL